MIQNIDCLAYKKLSKLRIFHQLSLNHRFRTSPCIIASSEFTGIWPGKVMGKCPFHLGQGKSRNLTMVRENSTFIL